MQYYYKKENKIVDESFFKKIGLTPTENNLKKAEIYPLTVEEISYNDKLESIEPDFIEKIDNMYIQKIKAVEITDEDILKEKLEKLIEEKFNEVVEITNSKIKPLLIKYSDEEIRTFSQQAKEAREWYSCELENKICETPMLDKLSSIRGIEKSKLVEKIINKTEEFENESLDIIGRQQALRDKIKSISEDENLTIKSRIIEIQNLELNS